MKKRDSRKQILYLTLVLIVGVLIGAVLSSATGMATADRGFFNSLFGGGAGTVDINSFEGKFESKEQLDIKSYNNFNDYVKDNIDTMTTSEMKSVIETQAVMLNQLANHFDNLDSGLALKIDSLVFDDMTLGEPEVDPEFEQGEGDEDMVCDPVVEAWCLIQRDAEGNPNCTWDSSDCSCHC
ncbi:MAG: hypothetical protein ABIJ18_02935 [archaeon]